MHLTYFTYLASEATPLVLTQIGEQGQEDRKEAEWINQIPSPLVLIWVMPTTQLA